MYGTGQLDSPKLANAGMPAQESILGNLNNSMETELKDLSVSARRLHSLADRIVGSRPEAVGKNGEATPASCALQAFERNVTGLQHLRSVITDAVERLERM